MSEHSEYAGTEQQRYDNLLYAFFNKSFITKISYDSIKPIYFSVILYRPLEQYYDAPEPLVLNHVSGHTLFDVVVSFALLDVSLNKNLIDWINKQRLEVVDNILGRLDNSGVATWQRIIKARAYLQSNTHLQRDLVVSMMELLEHLEKAWHMARKNYYRSHTLAVVQKPLAPVLALPIQRYINPVSDQPLLMSRGVNVSPRPTRRKTF
jgi:hypothetical protein